MRDDVQAAAYRTKFRKSLARRWSARRELALVGRALADLPRPGSLLDCPCGAGRLFPLLRTRADRLLACDLSPAMIHEARDAASAAPGALFVASALRLPLADASIDVVVCQRLLHHLRAREARRLLLDELARVSRVGVVLSFADAGTLRARMQRRRAGRSRRALPLAGLLDDAAAFGLAPAGPARRISGLFSCQAVIALTHHG